jgi:putative membrane protein
MAAASAVVDLPGMDPAGVEDSGVAAAASAAVALPGTGDVPFLTESDKERIEQAVAAAEGQTAAEFVTVIAGASGHYLYLPTLAAVTAMLLLSGIVLVIPWPFPVTVGQFYMGQVLGFIAFYGLFRWWPVRRRLVPHRIQRECARHRAHQAFLDLGLAATRDRTGVLFFVSAAEHYVEIITDRGVNSVVDDSMWENTVAEFTAAVRQGRIADGFLEAINACTRVLAERLPLRPRDIDELPNRPLEL